jgi:hypothetical protein
MHLMNQNDFHVTYKNEQLMRCKEVMKQNE